jgi:hypothetical protein
MGSVTPSRMPLTPSTTRDASTDVEYTDVASVAMSVPEHALVYFYLRLLARLQEIGTVPAMEFD